MADSTNQAETQAADGGGIIEVDNDDDDTVAILESSDSPGGGLCGAIPESGTCGALPTVDVKGRIIDLKQKGRGVISKLRNNATGRSAAVSSGDGSASLYDPSLYLCGATAEEEDYAAELDNREALESSPIPACVIGNPDRTVCVITTAALPWRTGTAVNPLLRALYLVRFQDEQREKSKNKKWSGNSVQMGDKSSKKLENEILASDSEVSKSNDDTGSVILVIPWLESEEDRIKLYGANNSFSNGSGMQEQEAWIRNYSSERCGMPLEASRLKMIFYPAFYLAGFGSIFPKVDLCNFIPRELVDVAILEEPEHLNWFRMLNNREKSMRDVDDVDVDALEEVGDDDDEETIKSSLGAGESRVVLGQNVELTINESPTDDLADVVGANDADQSNNDHSQLVQQGEENDTSNAVHPTETSQLQPSKKKKYIEKAKLGWTHRFRFVVGIVHTNYEAYARQYGIGASLIAAPAIGAVSALTIRAHCHQVIKLSDTLPDFAPGKEVTCNVHGVRREFLEGVDLDVLASASSSSAMTASNTEEKSASADAEEKPSPVYFIGKLVWAKGFDLMLELQDIFRKRNGGEYFHIDIYGGGPDEKAIARAFHGRHHSIPTKRPPPPSSKDATPDSSSHNLASVNAKDANAAAILSNPQSIKDQSSHVIEQMKQRLSLSSDGGDDMVAQYLSLGFEVCQMNGSATYVNESRDSEEGRDDSEPHQQSSLEAASSSRKKNPLDILGDLSEKSYDTGVKTSQAVYNIADSSIKNILTMSFSQLRHPLKSRMKKIEAAKPSEQDVKEKAATKGAGDNEKDEAADKPKFVFDPPASRYEWRRHPIPAKFPGVIDHAQLKNLPHKIFLNPSTSEVLCTTTAEALAMNKFVIIPKHPSNDFFLQFTNCLSYTTLDDCADKMAWALENIPTTMSDEERRKFTWEAATERLMESSVVTVKQARERAENGMDKTDARIAYWLSESGEKSHMIRNLFHKNGNNGGGDHTTMPLVEG